MLDQAFEALKTFDWGQDIKVLAAIDEAVVATHGDAAQRKELEDRLVATLSDEMPLDAKQFVCRKLMVIGTASVGPRTRRFAVRRATLAHGTLCTGTHSRCRGCGGAARLASKLSGKLKVGVISSLGTRQDADSIPMFGELLGDEDVIVARAAAYRAR